MKTRQYQIGIVALAAVSLIVFPNCVGNGKDTLVGAKITGGGNITPDAGTLNGTKPNFSVSGDSCDDPLQPTGRVQFHDNDAPNWAGGGGLRLQATVIHVTQCETAGGCDDQTGQQDKCPQGAYVASGGYQSTNPKFPGIGVMAACLKDNGEGKNGTGDLMGLGISGGPYDGYRVRGTVNGNIQGHACK